MATVIIPQNLPVGYRFHPTDEELVDHYLKLKVLGFMDNICIIPEVDICKWEPWELAQRFKEQSIIPSDDKVQEWWFFCPQMQRIQRSTHLGYWKKTGVDRTIKARDRNRAIGTKKTLVFHEGRSSKGIKTNWVVHEYHILIDNLDELFPHYLTKNYVLCRLKHKGDEKSDISTIQSKGGAFSLMDLDSDLCQSEHNNSFPAPWIQAVGNSSISLVDLDSDLYQPEHENSFPEPWIQAVGNSPISLVDLDSDLHQPEHENSFPEPWIQAVGNSSIGLVDLDSDLYQPEHENSFPEPWIQAVGNPPISLVDLDSDLHQPEHENSFPELWIQAVGNSPISSVDLHSDIHQPEHKNSFPEPWILVNSPTEPSLQQDNRVHTVTSILPQTSFQSENVDFRTNLHELRNFGSPSFADFGWDGGVAFIDESDQLQFDYIDRDQMQTQYGPTCSSDDEVAVLMKNRRTQTIESLHGVVPLDEKKGFIENKFNGLHISSPKHMEPPKKPEIARTYSTDEKLRVKKVEKLELAARNSKPECVTLDELEAKAKIGESREHGAATKLPQNNHNKGIEHAIEKSNSMPNLRGTITDRTKVSMVPPLYGQTSSSCNDHAMAEDWQTPTIETLHGQTSSSQNKNAMVTIELARGRGEFPPEEKKSFDGNESNSSNVLPLKRMDPLEKPATVRIYSKDEKTRFVEVKKQEVTARNIKPDCVSLDDSAAKAKSHNKHVLVGNPQNGTVEPLNRDVRLEKEKGLVKNKSDSLHISFMKDMELPERHVGVRIYCNDEPLRFEKLRKQDLAARNIKLEYVPLDESAAKAKHGQASRLHKEHILDGFAHLEGKKSFSENESNGRRIVLAEQMEHPKKAVNAGIYGKHEEPRLEKVNNPEFSAREISNRKVFLWLNQLPDQSHTGESNEHSEETESAREQSISAITLAGSTTNSTEIFAILSIVNVTNMLVFLIFSAISLNMRL